MTVITRLYSHVCAWLFAVQQRLCVILKLKNITGLTEHNNYRLPMIWGFVYTALGAMVTAFKLAKGSGDKIAVTFVTIWRH
jgi:hypothetical protein